MFGYWRTERRTLRQGVIALALSTGAGFVAGLALSKITGTLESLPGLLVLIPAAVGMRGSVFGAMAARLGTGVAAGIFESNLRRGGLLARNVEVAVISAVLTSFYLAFMAWLVAAALGESTISSWDLVTISVVGGVTASALILIVTVALAVLSYRRGWDLDAVATPMVTAIGDMVTIPALFLATRIVRFPAANALVATLCTAAAVGAVLWVIYRSDAAVRRTLGESAPVFALVPLLDIWAGALLQAHSAKLVAFPTVLILLPPFVSQAGALGGILASRLSSKLQVGVITPRGRPETPAIVDGGITVGLAFFVFSIIGAVSWGLALLTGAGHPSAAATISTTLAAGLLVLPAILLVGYYTAVATSRFGLDPDNYGVPFITSMMDLTGVAALLLVMRTSGVLV
jgi:mgtE-like transporter